MEANFQSTVHWRLLIKAKSLEKATKIFDEFLSKNLFQEDNIDFKLGQYYKISDSYMASFKQRDTDFLEVVKITSKLSKSCNLSSRFEDDISFSIIVTEDNVIENNISWICVESVDW